MRAKILIAAVLLLVGPAVAIGADVSSPSPSDLAFLESLAGPVISPSIGVPEPQLKQQLCTVTRECGDGTQASCTGRFNCGATARGVTCDGVETRCPNYCDISLTCQCPHGWFSLFCFSLKGDCQQTSNGIACDGLERTCESSCPD